MAIKINPNSGGGAGSIKVNMPQKPQQPSQEQIAAQQAAAAKKAAEEKARQQALLAQQQAQAQQQQMRDSLDFDAPLGSDPFAAPAGVGSTAQFSPVQQQQAMPQQTPQQPTPKEEEDFEEPKGKRGKGKRGKKDKASKPKAKKDKTKKNKKGKGEDDEVPESIDAAYKSYRVRKIVVLATVIAFLLALIIFGTYSTFFKHDLTAYEAAVYTNAYNGQATSQQWDSGVQSFLEANLYEMLTTNFSSSGDVKEFTVDNISVERNIAYGDTMFLTFFSADIETNGSSERVFMSIWISVENSTYEAASSVTISSRAAYSSYDGTTVDNSYLEFDDSELNSEDSTSFQSALNNFLTLGYNTGGDTSQIYVGESELDFSGATYIQIDSCSVYDTENNLGFNAVATYKLELDNGVQFTTTSYFDISLSSSGAWVINRIL